MGPREVLEELDRTGMTIFWYQLGAHPDPDTKIETDGRVPPELRAAIDAHTETLLQVVSRRKANAPGLFYRPPGSGGAS